MFIIKVFTHQDLFQSAMKRIDVTSELVDDWIFFLKFWRNKTSQFYIDKSKHWHFWDFFFFFNSPFMKTFQGYPIYVMRQGGDLGFF